MGGAVAALSGEVPDVTVSPPSAGLMTGMMRLVRNDTVFVVELISMMDTPRCRDAVSPLLLGAQSRRSAFVRTSDDAYVARSASIGSDGKPGEVVATYRRVR